MQQTKSKLNNIFFIKKSQIQKKIHKSKKKSHKSQQKSIIKTQTMGKCYEKV